MGKTRILLVDDDSSITTTMSLILTSLSPDFSVASVDNGQAALDYLNANESDCIISDYQMPGMNGIELLKALRNNQNDIPFIFFTAQGSEEVATDAFKEGASDYFTKDAGFAYFQKLTNSIKRAVAQRDNSRAKAKAEAELLRAKLEWEETFNSIDDLITLQDSEYTILQTNTAVCAALGVSAEEIVGRKCYELFHHTSEPIHNCPAHELLEGDPAIITHQVDVQGRTFEVKVCPILQEGRIKSFVHIAKDVTDRKSQLG